MKKLSLIYSAFFVFLLSSCATMYTGSRKIIHFSSDPQKAEVSINGKVIGETPLTVRVNRSLRRREVVIKKDGYETKRFKLEKKFVPISILSTTMIPIDLISGAVVNYKDAYIHKELTPKDKNVSTESNYNIKDNFYVITHDDTIYTAPFQDFTKEWFLSNYLKDMRFNLINGEEQVIPVSSIYKYKTLEIDKFGLWYGFLSFRTNVRSHEASYVRVKIDEKKNKSLYMFMEELLYNDGYQLLSSYQDVKPFTSSSYNRELFYYLCKEGKIIGVVKKGQFLPTVRQFFGDEKELVEKLKKKNKPKVLEKYLYQKRSNVKGHL
jgi:RNase P/RNase MRP subunit p29